MNHTLTEKEIRVMYQEKQKEPFSRNKQILGAVCGIILILGFIALYLGIWAFLMDKLSDHDLPNDVIYTALVF